MADGRPFPFRRELAEMALTMARTVQVEKGHGVIFATREPVLYTAPLSAATVLPDEVTCWALELAGRQKIADEVTERIAEVRRKEVERHAERLRIDPEYRAQHEKRREVTPFIGSGRQRLPPWPLGAKRRVDHDFRHACLNDNGLAPLMHVRPEAAVEVLLALIIEDEPFREYHSSRHEIELGLEFAQSAYQPVRHVY